MITIISMQELAQKTKYTIGFNAWDFPIEELDYLIENHSGETFVLCNGRLTEVEVLYEN